jgi:hypothetical protein
MAPKGKPPKTPTAQQNVTLATTPTSQGGSTVAPTYTERRMKFYNVEEAELFAITALDLVASILLSFTMAFVAFFFGANWDLLLASGLPPDVLTEAKAARAASFWFIVVFAALTAVAVIARFVVTNNITRTSRVIDVKL